MKIEKQLFDLVNQIGDIQSNGLHIIEKDDRENIECEYRVYHNTGFCFDIAKKPIFDNETNQIIDWEYSFFSDFEGFEEINETKAIELLKPYKVK